MQRELTPQKLLMLHRWDSNEPRLKVDYLEWDEFLAAALKDAEKAAAEWAQEYDVLFGGADLCVDIR